MKKVLAALEKVQEQRAQVLASLARPEPLVVGSLQQVRRRCGKPTCHCVSGPGHVRTHLMTSKAGRARCQLVRKDDLNRVREAVERYREYRKALLTLKRLNAEEHALLLALRGIREKPYR